MLTSIRDSICVFVIICTILNLISRIDSFTSLDVNEDLSDLLDELMEANLGRVDNTFSHQTIIKIGTLKSIAKYFDYYGFDVDYGKVENFYAKDLTYLYRDLFKKRRKSIFLRCDLELESILKTLEFAVASVDFDPNTKDLPTAHFDAEMIKESNERVAKQVRELIATMAKKDFVKARIQIGTVLHTIQDFYAHTNWVEMGKIGINQQIGLDIKKYPVIVASKSDKDLCISNCKRIEVDCTLQVDTLKRLAQLFKLNFNLDKCPIVYFECDNNVAINKLTSGYVTGSKLENGTEVKKPEGWNKCSHGGRNDDTAFEAAEGGINKDSGFYFISPHAHLHRFAATLAIQHTEMFIDSLRSVVGDEFFAQVFGLKLKKHQKSCIDKDAKKYMLDTSKESVEL